MLLNKRFNIGTVICPRAVVFIVYCVFNCVSQENKVTLRKQRAQKIQIDLCVYDFVLYLDVDIQCTCLMIVL